jgi:hypothetical protein
VKIRGKYDNEPFGPAVLPKFRMRVGFLRVWDEADEAFFFFFDVDPLGLIGLEGNSSRVVVRLSVFVVGAKAVEAVADVESTILILIDIMTTRGLPVLPHASSRFPFLRSVPFSVDFDE